MLTHLPTADRIANIIDENVIVGAIYFQDKDQQKSEVKMNQCEYCLRDYSKLDHLRTHQRTCRVMQAQEREDNRHSFFKEMQIPLTRTEVLKLSFPLAKGERLVMFICGRNGCGKSSYIQKILKEYLKVYRTRKIILFSQQEFDDKLDPIFKNLKRVDLGHEFTAEPYALDELRNLICIFYGADSIRDKKLKDAVFKLRDEIMKNGRSHTKDREDDIDIIISNHDILGGNETKTMIRESIFYVVFPKGSTPAQLHALTKTYAGLKKEHIKRIMDNEARAVLIHNGTPGYVLTEKEIFLT